MSVRIRAEFRMPRAATMLATFALCPVLACPRAAALDIQLSYSGGFENRPLAVAAMEQAAAVWESWLADPIVVDFKVREESILNLPFGAQGGAFPNWYEETVPAFLDAMVQDQSSADDALALTSLPAGPRLRFQTWDPERNPVINEGDDWINNWVLMPRAQMKALGLPLEGVDPDPDAEILWSDYFLNRVFDFDRSDGIDGTDFQAVAIHEIGHALGFSSGTESYDQLHAGLLSILPEQINDYPVLLPLDMFRYSAQSPTLIDVTPGNDAYFSIDGGMTSLGTFATGESFGDGWQAGHWKVGQGGIMDATWPDDEIHNLTALDLRAMDAIGWDLAGGGDFNHDGTYDGRDFLAWQRGESPNPLSAADLTLWEVRYGVATPIASTAAQILEPTSLLLATLALAGVAFLSADDADVRR